MMGSITGNIISSVAGVSLLILIGAGVRNPQLFDNSNYSNLSSLIVGGMLGALTSQQTQPAKQEDDDYRVK